MGRKIFVTYKHGDRTVQPIQHTINQRGYDGDTIEYLGTARDYVDYLIYFFEGDEIYKGEGNEDLSEFKDETIKTHLKEKIHDSSVTLVLISPNMKEPYKKEDDQWIPWEVSYALKEIERHDKMSHTNAVLAVVLPDQSGYYNYYIDDNAHPNCDCRMLRTDTLFQILKDNHFNRKQLERSGCRNHPYSRPTYTLESSYIVSVKWEDFLNDKDQYLDIAVDIRDHRNDYKITREITQ